MKVNIVENEIFPVYSLWAGPTGTTIDMSEAEVAEFKQAHKQWEEWQDEIDRRLRQMGDAVQPPPMQAQWEWLSDEATVRNKPAQEADQFETDFVVQVLLLAGRPLDGDEIRAARIEARSIIDTMTRDEVKEWVAAGRLKPWGSLHDVMMTVLTPPEVTPPAIHLTYPLKWWQLWRWNPRTRRYHYKYKWVRSCKEMIT